MSILHSTLLGVLNHLLRNQGWATARLQPFAGQQMRVEGGPFPLLIAVTESGQFGPANEHQAADVTITLPADFLLRAAVDRDQLFASVRLAGTADFTETLAFVFRNLGWDVEADLSRLVGDIAAHRLVKTGRALHAWQGDARQRLLDNLAEYATEDSDLLVAGREIQALSQANSTLRDDLARLEKRLQKLERQ